MRLGYMMLVSAPLWIGLVWLRRIARDARIDADREFQENCYHHLIDLAEMLLTDLHELKMSLDGEADVSKKMAYRLAKSTPKDVDRWAIRAAALNVVDRLTRLGQAVKLKILDIETVWDSNGETVLSAHRRVQHLVEALQERNPALYPTYHYLIDELENALARRRLDEL